MPWPIPPDEPRSPAELRHQYEVERELAGRLIRADPRQRPALYGEVYDELLRRLPEQPMIRQRNDRAAREHLARLQSSLLEPFLAPESRLLEVGAGDATLAVQLASRLREVVVVEASQEILAGLEPPDNLRLIQADATRLAVPEGSIDVAFSCHFIEHLHPEDALVHATEVRRILTHGGAYVVVTPNRLWGPHDVSRYFSDEPRGLHLREYTHGELARTLRRAGFRTVRVLRGVGRPPTLRPLFFHRALEATLGALPRGLRRPLLGRLSGRHPPPFRPLEQVKLAAWR